MKITVRIVALLISVVMLISSFISCSKNRNAEMEATEGSSQTQPSTDETLKEEQRNYIFEIVYPSVSVSSFKFELTDAKFAEYQKKMSATKSLFNNNKKESGDEFRNALYELLSLQAEMEAQRDIAYLQYCYDMSNSDAWDNYLYAYEMHDDANDLFWAFYNQSKTKSNNLSKVFKEVVQEVYQGTLVSVTSSVDSYAYDMEVLEGEYNSLKNSNASDEEIFEVYKKYMIAADTVAVFSNTDNYYEYASKHLYYRKDTLAQRETLRKYTKEYLIPLYRELKAKSYAYDSQLSNYEYNLSNKYLYNKYSSFDEDYLDSYFSSLPRSAGEGMKTAFENDRVLIGNTDSSYDSAMVYTVGNTPICYFHEDRTTLETMSHELGHYYANTMGSDKHYYSYNLRETHSTANTMLFYSYLSDRLDSKAFTSVELYMIYSWVYQIISSVIKDEFDEIIYTSDVSTLTLEDFERIMSELIDEYDVSDMSNNIVNQLMTYWRRLGIVYPMSNYCYATAIITSLQIYIKSKEDYAAASELYRKTVEKPVDKGDFISTIVKAGLKTPYDEQTYIELKKLTEIY